MSGLVDEMSKRKLRSLWRVYKYILDSKGVTARDIMRGVVIARSTAYEILRLLENYDLIYKEYKGRKAIYWPVERIYEFDKFVEALRNRDARMQVTVYDIASDIESDFTAFNLKADFVGAIAIQRRLIETTGTPPVARVTRDINIGTVTEEVPKIKRILELHGFHYIRTKYNVIVYFNSRYGITVWLHPDGFPSPINTDVLAIEFREALLKTGKIPVEYTVAGKFFDYPMMAKKNIQDLTLILSRDPELSLDLIVDIFVEAIRRDPPLERLIFDSLNFFLTADDGESMPDDMSIARKKTRYIIDHLKVRLDLERRKNNQGKTPAGSVVQKIGVS